MKTILHISKYYYPYLGGIETVAMYLAEGMKDYKNIVICFSTDKKYHEDEINDVKIYRVPVEFSFMSQDVAFNYYGVLKKLFRLYNPDFCHVHCPNPFVYPLITNLIPRHTKLVLHWHSDILDKGLMYILIKPFEDFILERGNCIISTSPNYIPCSKPLLKYPEKVKVAQNGLITSNFELKPGEEKQVQEIKDKYGNKPLVYFVGRHIPYKGIDTLIKADKFIKNDCVILIAGKGPLDEYLKSIPCSNRVKFLGRLSDEDLRCYSHAADIFAFPSNTKAEAFGIALAEAMYCKNVPVTFTLEGSGVNWVSIASETGIEVPLGETKLFADAIDILISNPDLRQKYSEASYQRVTNNFTTAKAIDKMMEIYAEL